ncbi:hypothetical protein EWM64_g8500 [Hericium alpestre]|uniref:Uncharacterized protein n=1 Tax=Hericium alpestre TaxID=135208 RepID=A0A4Y9ZL07_9AGAM|nr:hypothetical protein EWM64_g8500 [Hericium alpestre]
MRAQAVEQNASSSNTTTKPDTIKIVPVHDDLVAQQIEGSNTKPEDDMDAPIDTEQGELITQQVEGSNTKPEDDMDAPVDAEPIMQQFEGSDTEPEDDKEVPVDTEPGEPEGSNTEPEDDKEVPPRCCTSYCIILTYSC